MQQLKLFLSLFLPLLICTGAQAGTEIRCQGVVIEKVGVDSNDQMRAVEATFLLETQEDGRATITLTKKRHPPIIGTAQPTGIETMPWKLLANNHDGTEFTGRTIAIQSLNEGEPTQFMAIDLKSESLMIGGPMACTLSATQNGPSIPPGHPH